MPLAAAAEIKPISLEEVDDRTVHTFLLNCLPLRASELTELTNQLNSKLNSWKISSFYFPGFHVHNHKGLFPSRPQILFSNRHKL